MLVALAAAGAGAPASELVYRLVKGPREIFTTPPGPACPRAQLDGSPAPRFAGRTPLGLLDLLQHRWCSACAGVGNCCSARWRALPAGRMRLPPARRPGVALVVAHP